MYRAKRLWRVVSTPYGDVGRREKPAATALRGPNAGRRLRKTVHRIGLSIRGKEPQTIEINLKQDGYVLQITIFV